MSKEQYDKLLKLVDEIFNRPKWEAFPENGFSYKDDFDWPEEEPFSPEDLLRAYPTELATILESKIFSNGQLKGAAGYDRSYQIIDLVEFISLLCDKMHHYHPIDVSVPTAYALHNLVEAIDDAKIEIRDLFGKHESTQINALKGKIEAWLKTSKDSSLQPVFIPTERDLSDFITDLFKKHISGAPKLIIFERVSELLNLFGIDVKPKNLNMREYRKMKTSPKK